jgi:hypothetical protein
MDTRQTDTRRHRLTRRSALAGLGAAALVGLTALAGGATATASPRPVAPSAPAASAHLSVTDLRWASMPTTSPAARPAAPVRYGSCSASMMDF